MSKHPIPDWLRSQFSRIEDDVRKLGPCGVFTQMRTVTQTYFEQQAEAPQPPALGGEPEEETESFAYKLEFLGKIDRCDVACGSYGDKFHRWVDDGPYVEYEDHLKHIDIYKAEVDRLIAHLAPLHAEIERLNNEVDGRDQPGGEDVRGRLIAAYGAGRWLNEYDALYAERDQLKARCDEQSELLRQCHRLLSSEALGGVCSGMGDADKRRWWYAEVKPTLTRLAALSKPAGSERVCHLCRGEGRVGGPAPDEGGGKNCGLCGGTGMEVQS